MPGSRDRRALPYDAWRRGERGRTCKPPLATPPRYRADSRRFRRISFRPSPEGAWSVPSALTSRPLVSRRSRFPSLARPAPGSASAVVYSDDANALARDDDRLAMADASIPQGRYLNIDGGMTLHYHDAGRGHPVVFLHGSGPGASGYSNFKGNYPA